ncbi:polysaccharide pyruvyl transferase family protein [Tessaracoccus lacteus]|uniref:Polysaccharide pyruvyl transferase family protein n=1 Tax=Tessaracoccus lacteus TaxID=3041766 RepID=A0ABY8PWZ1_9ACTN|nr:polysaccharide pyruvyl transferase family protein [Tessaracoccus sp. T21]WGT46995.1 polysaccharide pyruvyl transferase family protein [Tessaracoccus sp. T21]
MTAAQTTPDQSDQFKILLLTNRDSDNVGDQLIEASAISLIEGAMQNLGIARNRFSIHSRAAGMITKAYMKTGDPKQIESAKKSISESDVVIFGGAPLFNYRYQLFYLRTIRTIELAQEYGVPVLFSSIGVEKYDEASEKSMELKKALALPVVRQITTRDDIDSLRKYVAGTDVSVAHVSDPAVFADIVFSPKPKAARPAPKPAPAAPTSLRARVVGALPGPVEQRLRKVLHRPKPTQTPSTVPSPAAPTASVPERKKKIGLVVTRAGIFADNKIDFTAGKQRQLWLDIIRDLKARGYDYHLFTTGHFADEVLLDQLVKDDKVPAGKVTFTVNSPEELHAELSSCDGVIAYRLHASIASFAYGIPSIGLSWNFKVPYFYESVGHGDRALPVEKWTAEDIVPALEKAMAEGVHKDEAFLMTVYETLFAGLKGVFAPGSTAKPYTYAELHTELPRYAGTTEKDYRGKVTRKLRRTYEAYRRHAY